MTSTRRKSSRPPWAMAAVVKIWMGRFRLLLLLLGVTTFTTTTAFTILPIAHAFELCQPSCSFRRHNNPTTTRLSLAIIYDPDGQRVKDDDEYDDKEYLDTTAVLSVLQDALQHRLQNNKHKNTQQVLIRIACAHALPPHDTLLPSQVVSWNLVSIQPSSSTPPPSPPSSTQIIDDTTSTKTILQVALGVPQEEEEPSSTRDRGSTTVAQILVGIPLSTSCDYHTTTSEQDATTTKATAISTIIDAILVELEERLDPMACRILQAREEEQQQQQNVATPPSERQLIVVLPDDKDDDEYDLPEWWTINGALTDECTLLRSILNEDDFTSDLLRLVSTAATNNTTSSSTSWSQAKVVLVGPSGIIVRAVRTSSSSSTTTTTTTTTTIPIRFETLATTRKMLRSLVLDLVEETGQAQEQPQDAAKKPAAGPPPPPPIEEALEDIAMTTTTGTSRQDAVRRRRQEQPKSPHEEAQLAAKYAAISNLGDRAYAILKDLGMI